MRLQLLFITAVLFGFVAAAPAPDVDVNALVDAGPNLVLAVETVPLANAAL
jgi:hypothetical protein